MPFAMEVEEHREEIDLYPGAVVSDILPNGNDYVPLDPGGSGPSLENELESKVEEDFVDDEDEEEEEDDDDDDGEDIANVAPASDMSAGADVNGIQRSSPAATPVSRRTPRSTKSASAPARQGRKRKSVALENEPEAKPAKRRGRPPAAPRPATSAYLAAKAATKPTRGRPRNAAATKTIKAAARKVGRPRGSTAKGKGAAASGKVPAGEYEVEEIIESAIDADTMEHMYRVKWAGYSLKEATWEPRKNLTHAADLVREFDAKQKKKAQPNDTAENGEKKERKKPGRKPRAKA